MTTHRTCALTAVIAILIGLPLAADWPVTEAIDLDAVYRIKDEGLQHSKVMDIESYLTDVYGPRLTGSPNIKEAADWAQKTMRDWGLANVHLETWPFGRGWQNQRFVALAMTPRAYPLIGYPKAWTPGTNGRVTRTNLKSGGVEVLCDSFGGFPLGAPNDLTTDSKSRIWVSEWNSGNVSVHDPADGSWKAWKLPGAGPRTYAVYVDEKDKVWLTDFGANAIVRFDPTTEKFDSFPSDMASANVRQLAGRPGETWGGESGTNRLVRIQTSTRIIVVVGEHAEKTSRSCGCPIASSDDLTRRWIGRMCGLGEQEE